jgi:polyhydroxybutyrate depolymerase
MESPPVVAPRRRRRGSATGIVLLLVSLPSLVALVEAVSFHGRNRNTGSLVSGGETREYLLHVPKGYDATTPTALVISLHGGALWPAAQRDLSRWNALADEEGFIVVYPAGAGRIRSRIWHVNRGPGLPRDVQFIADLIDTLRAAYNIDPERIYANGLSNGAGMAFVLSCTLADRIAAVGLVASALLLPWEWCAEPRPMPMIAFHGTADPITPYHGGVTWVAPTPFPDVPAFVAKWARRNGCATSPRDSTVASDVSLLAYLRGDCAAAVALYTVKGGGHAWPGGQPVPEWFAGPTTRSIDATRLMWGFFREHRLARHRLDR